MISTFPLKIVLETNNVFRSSLISLTNTDRTDTYSELLPGEHPKNAANTTRKNKAPENTTEFFWKKRREKKTKHTNQTKYYY